MNDNTISVIDQNSAADDEQPQQNAAKSEPDRYADRVMACWLGKAVGGTLGMPFEGRDGPLDLDFYRPVPTEMLPNDDLDLQVVWACVINQLETARVDRHILAQGWLDHVTFPWDEYGVAIRNLKNGLKPPLTGSFDNWFINGMGSPIRSEIWACLAPGNPELAAAYAKEDACVDHAAEGICGEMFFAALESLAFVESNYDVLLDRSLAILPATSIVRRAVGDTRTWWAQTRDWMSVRDSILRDYGHENFTDAPMNIAFTILGWLAAEGDFGRAICIAVNCGKDTDCTGATVGALMGILDPDCIPEKWLAPIGRDLVLSSGIVGLQAPASLDDFTALVLDLRTRLNGQWPSAETFEQSTEHLKIAATIGFLGQMPPTEGDLDLPTDVRQVVFDGTIGRWPWEDFEDGYLLVRYLFTLKESRAVLALFNTRDACQVRVDGGCVFSRESRSMAPSFHRTRDVKQVDLAAGQHTLTAIVKRPKERTEAEWVVGIGDPKSQQWLPDALLM
jgi:ADP-ribosylglycohydrolase